MLILFLNRKQFDDLQKQSRNSIPVSAETIRLVVGGSVRMEVQEEKSLTLADLNLLTRTRNAIELSGYRFVRDILAQDPHRIASLKQLGNISFLDFCRALEAQAVILPQNWQEYRQKILKIKRI